VLFRSITDNAHKREQHDPADNNQCNSHKNLTFGP
jgi:hypothetical protein